MRTQSILPLNVNGARSMTFTANDAFDIGMESYSPVSLAYFNGARQHATSRGARPRGVAGGVGLILKCQYGVPLTPGRIAGGRPGLQGALRPGEVYRGADSSMDPIAVAKYILCARKGSRLRVRRIADLSGPIQPYRCQYTPMKMSDWAR